MASDQDSLGLCGKTLGKFQIQALLGAGGYGVVYRAFDTNLKRSVALKVLSPQDATRSDLVERFVREARLAAKLDHPNIVRIHHVGLKDGYYYIEMELVEGKSVAELIEERSQGLPQAQVLNLAEQMADALQAAHDEANFIHRDLKPSNVLVTNAGVVKLVDFGLAKPLSKGSAASLRTTGGIFLGTTAYASPEQCRGETPDCRSDIYSFGATLYHMLTGVPPIPPAKDENDLQLLNRIGTEVPVPVQQRVPGLDPNLCAIVMKMLAKQPSDRYPSVRAIRHDLKAVKDGRPLSQSIVGGQTRRTPLQHILTPRDEALISAAQALGYLTPEQVQDSKASLEAVLQAGSKVSLDRLLLDKKYLSREQLKRVVAELHSRGFHPTIGQYEVLAKLGAGGTATVYKARDKRSGRIVALKVLSRAMTTDGLTAERFLRGAVLAAKVQHPNIVQVLESGQDGRDYFLAMEYVEGVVLSAKATIEAPLPEREALDITKQIASGLAACHAQGIVHRDVKPSNIIVTASGLAKLTDLGIARNLEPGADDVTMAGHTVGTPHYMSPEQCASSKDVDARSDIYSLGATLFFMLTGQPPFYGVTVLDVMKQQSSSQLPNPRQFNPAVSDMTHSLLWKMMSKTQAGRPQTAEELIADIERVERMQPDGERVADEMQELLAQIVKPAEREKLGRSILRRVKALDQRLEAVKTLSATWGKYAAYVKQAREGATFSAEDETAFAALGGRISGEYMSVLPLLERPDRGGPAIKHCGQGRSLSATAQDRRSLAALEKGCQAGAKLLSDFQVFLEQSRRKTISENFLRYNIAKYLGTPRRKIAATIALALIVLLSWVLIGRLYGKVVSVTYQQTIATTPPTGVKPGHETAQPTVPTLPAKVVDLPKLTLDCGNGVPMKLNLIPAGEFMMGSPANEAVRQENEGPQHRVRITRPFYMGVYAVTQAQYEAVMGVNPSQFKGESNPVETVSWNDVVEFCKKLSAKTGQTVRLPTEAEWEYACRAGTTTRFYSGDADGNMDAVGWYSDNSGGKTHAVGEKKPNAWGLYDMHGNVWQWCEDWQDSYPGAEIADPQGPPNGQSRVVRGGSGGDSPRNCRSAVRGGFVPSYRNNDAGFRVVCAPRPLTAEKPAPAATAAPKLPAEVVDLPKLTLDCGNAVTMKLNLIPAGEFMMGSPASEGGRTPDEPAQHRVRITKPFYMGVYAVTQAQYEAVMGVNPSQFKGESNPVETVSWNDVVEFCKKLSAKTGQTVRLPTEAEWEYVCRAGTTTRFYSGDADGDLAAVGWYSGNSGGKTHAVGEKKPNAWGLYDMHGNVREWCQDWYGSYPADDAVDPQGSSSGQSRVLRGGSWYYFPGFCRSAIRDWLDPSLRGYFYGFRVVCAPRPSPTAPVQVKPVQETAQPATTALPAIIAAHVKGRQTLDLSHTQVTDADLATLKDWKDLRELNLWNDTQFTDAGLVYLRELKSMQKLVLADTKVTDAGLVNLSEMRGMQWLDLNRTQVGDAGLVQLEEMKGLQVLCLARTHLTDAGLVQLKKMKAFRSLELGGTQITDAGLTNLKEMTGLEWLGLYDTPVTDAGLAQLREMRGLQWLDLNRTQVGDAGLVQLEEMKGLQVLCLARTHLTDAGLVQLKKMKAFRSLELGGTQITDAGLTNLKEMTGLEWLGLYDTQVTDAGLACLEEMKGLQWLDLNRTQVTDAGLAHLKGLKGLKHLGLQTTQVTDAGLAELKVMKGLESLDLGRTQVTDAGLAQLKEMKGIQEIILWDTKVSDAALADLKAALPNTNIHR